MSEEIKNVVWSHRYLFRLRGFINSVNNFLVLLQINHCWRLNCDFHRLWFGEGVRTHFTYCRLPVLLGWLFCKWRWGLSDKTVRDERRRANTGLSSKQIQFHSINIDVLLSPANGLTLPSGCRNGWYTLATLAVMYTLEGQMFKGIKAICTLNVIS